MPQKVMQEIETLRRENEILRKEIALISKKYEMAVTEREANVKGFTATVTEQANRIGELENLLDARCDVCCGHGKKAALKSFAERVKMAFYYHYDEIIPSIMADEIDKILEEMESKSNEQKSNMDI